MKTSKRITYKEINKKLDKIEKKLEKINQNEVIKKSDLINFILFRIKEINEDMRTIYSSFWQKFSVIIALTYAILSTILAFAAISGVDAVVKVLSDPELLRPIVGTFIFLLFLNILLPIVVSSIENYKKRECLNEYENVISKILFEKLNDNITILKHIKKIEEKYSLNLTIYLRQKTKQAWLEFKKEIKESIERP